MTREQWKKTSRMVNEINKQTGNKLRQRSMEESHLSAQILLLNKMVLGQG